MAEPQKIKYMTDSPDVGLDVADHQQEDTGHEQDASIALISDGHNEDGSEDGDIDTGLDDDFYDTGEFFDEASGEGAPDTGF